MTNQLMKSCKHCGKVAMHYEPSTSHSAHLLMSIITAGLWLLVWPWFVFSHHRKAQCSICGRPARDNRTKRNKAIRFGVWVALAVTLAVSLVFLMMTFLIPTGVETY